MKAVDITLLLQALNFFLVYCILSRYVFYPAMRILRDLEKSQNSVYVAISKVQEQKDEVVQEKKKQWIMIKKSLHALIPSFSTKLFRQDSLEEQSYAKQHEKKDFSDQQKENMKKIMAKELMDIES